MQVDMTALICDALIQPFNTVPSEADDLASLIAAPLIRKLPVSFQEERKFPQFAEFIQAIWQNTFPVYLLTYLKSRT